MPSLMGQPKPRHKQSVCSTERASEQAGWSVSRSLGGPMEKKSKSKQRFINNHFSLAQPCFTALRIVTALRGQYSRERVQQGTYISSLPRVHSSLVPIPPSPYLPEKVIIDLQKFSASRSEGEGHPCAQR